MILGVGVLTFLVLLALLIANQTGPKVEHQQHTATEWQADELPGWMKQIETQVPQRWNEGGSPHRILVRGQVVDIWTTPENQTKISRLLGDAMRNDGRTPPR